MIAYSFTINSDRLSIPQQTAIAPQKNQPTNQRSPIHPHNQRSPLKKSTKQRSPIQSLLTSDRHS
ncbi:MAG: hypothetical protein ACK47J_17060, partial [Pseudanabaena sp.]